MGVTQVYNQVVNNIHNLVFLNRMLSQLRGMLPDFVVANAVVHFDEASPHMHVVGVPVGRGFKCVLETKVSKRSVFTQETLANVLQGELKELAESNTEMFFDVGFKEKQKGKNHDLLVMEYKVAKETEKQKELETVKEERDALEWECKNQQERNEYVNGLYERMDKENDRLREENRELGFFRKYLSRDEYEKIIERGEGEREIRR